MKPEALSEDTIEDAEISKGLTDKIIDILDGHKLTSGTFALGSALAIVIAGSDMSEKDRKQFIHTAFPDVLQRLVDLELEVLDHGEQKH